MLYTEKEVDDLLSELLNPVSDTCTPYLHISLCSMHAELWYNAMFY